jgi:2,5-diketo-D-gluconate reductase B
VETAIGLGYRHIDTAEIYQNEQGIGEAIGGRPEPLFLTSKVFYHHLHRDDVFGACLGSPSSAVPERSSGAGTGVLFEKTAR